MARNYMRTVNDMERYYYGAGQSMGYSYSGSELLKADAPMLSTTAGTYQAIYGRKVWSQLNQEFNAFSILPKKPWDRSGWRVVTSKPSSSLDTIIWQLNLLFFFGSYAISIISCSASCGFSILLNQFSET